MAPRTFPERNNPERKNPERKNPEKRKHPESVKMLASNPDLT